ncbi:MAG TPA: YrdB family protein [Anaerolineales bacterium]|nr:YrdB family protein [Anaerolineales bacterium]
MNIFKTLNLLVRFLLELCMLAAIGYWGFKTQSSWAMRIIFGIGLPVLIIVIWALFVAPKAIYPLHGMSHIVLSLILLGSGALALFASGRADLGWVYVIVLIVNQVLLIVWKQ